MTWLTIGRVRAWLTEFYAAHQALGLRGPVRFCVRCDPYVIWVSTPLRGVLPLSWSDLCGCRVVALHRSLVPKTAGRVCGLGDGEWLAFEPVEEPADLPYVAGPA